MEKSSNKVVWWIIGVVVILAIGGVVAYALANQTKQPSPETTGDASSKTKSNKTDAKTNGDTPTSSDSQQTTGVTIVFTDKGFEKSSYTVKKGQSVKVENKSNTQLEFSSDNHPTHTGEPELNMSVLQPGESGSFTPTEIGEHGFHDHLQAQFTGVLVVTE